MDRRRFLAAGGLAAVSPALAQPGVAKVAPGEDPALFQTVNFYSDGVDYTPAEYAQRLQALAATGALQADNYSLGGAVQALEKTFADALGKPAAMFVPTGTLANHLAVRTLAGADRRVLVQAESHLYNDSGDGAGLLSGLSLVPLGLGGTGMALDEVRSWVERSAGGRVPNRVGVLSIESPVRRRDHAFVPYAELQALCAYARGQGIRLHLDGARLFSLPLHSGHSVREYAALFDTVYVSTWKHFDGASGAILAGEAEVIDGLYHQRRLFGGGLPHAWPLMALAEASVAGFEADYARAWQAAEQVIALLSADARFSMRRIANGTSRFYLRVQGVALPAFVAAAQARSVLLPGAPAGADEMAMQVNLSLLRSPPALVARKLLDAASA
ncbi:threonine aldolase family protein [Arenimonas sp. MALMAid1274]|uniref:threonine aldolase family protein n=1 Tax=Arenimonas sp. MALMAid1274 TaxID=3411630 RepID=UPI003B9F9744